MKWLKRLIGVKPVKIPEAVPASCIRLVKSDDHERILPFSWDNEEWVVQYPSRAEKLAGQALLFADCSDSVH